MHDGVKLLAVSGVGAVIGGAAGLTAVAREHKHAVAVLEEDVRRLETGQEIPPIVEPSHPGFRTKKGMARCYLTGAAIGGFVVWLVIFTLIVLVPSGDDTPAMRFVAALFFGGVAGLVGLFLPGVLIGAWLWITESRARVSYELAVFRRRFWEEREAMRAGLVSGDITVPSALAVLQGNSDHF